MGVQASACIFGGGEEITLKREHRENTVIIRGEKNVQLVLAGDLQSAAESLTQEVSCHTSHDNCANAQISICKINNTKQYVE